jgi:hypothetical protein
MPAKKTEPAKHPASVVGPQKTDAAKKKDEQKGKEKWRHKVISGSAHPDHKPPVTIIAQASPEAAKRQEDAINAEREKALPHADWRDYEGGVEPEPDKDAPKPQFPKEAKPSHN